MPGRRSTSCSDGPGRWSTPGRSKGRRRARRAEGGGREASRRGQLVNDRRGDRLGEGAGIRQPLLEFVAEGHEAVDLGDDAVLFAQRGNRDRNLADELSRNLLESCARRRSFYFGCHRLQKAENILAHL